MTRRIANSVSGAPTLRGPDLGTHHSTLITSAGIETTQDSRKASRTNFVTLWEPGSGDLDGGLTTSRVCTNSGASVPATFTPGEASCKRRADLAFGRLPASGLTSTLRVGIGTDRVQT